MTAASICILQCFIVGFFWLNPLMLFHTQLTSMGAVFLEASLKTEALLCSFIDFL